jgi:hypothetical protein
MIHMEYAPAIIFMQRTLSPRKDEEATAFTVLADFYPQSANMHSKGRLADNDLSLFCVFIERKGK